MNTQPHKISGSVSVKPLEDGPNGNSIKIYALMLTVKMVGVDHDWTKRIGEFSEGYETIAREFVECFNQRMST